MKIASIEFALIVAATSMTVAMLSVTANAQGTPQQQSACMGDAFRFCGADIPDVSKIEACLSQNRSDLTPACAAEFPPQGKTRLQRKHFR